MSVKKGVAILVSLLVLVYAFSAYQANPPVKTEPSALSSTPPVTKKRTSIPLSPLDHHFCRSTPAEVDAGTAELLNTLNDITNKSYFRYYKVNSEKDCPYWGVSLLCSAENACDVCKCDESSIPVSLRVEQDMSDVRTPGAEVSQAVPHPGNVDDWGAWEEESGAQYVDLVQNPEGNTGYSGPMAAKVWTAIYRENCFPLEGEEEQCSEVTILRRLFSGIHMSINLHVCTNFYKDLNHSSPQRFAGIYNNPAISFYPNCEMYNARVAAAPQFVENLYVVYQFVLRALKKAEPYFTADWAEYRTGNETEDAALVKDLQELFNTTLLCSRTFDEAGFLHTPKGRSLIPEMSRMVMNVTRLMDCVACEKCRIWGKLEMKGLLVALKLNTHNATTDATLTLDRAEKVSLMNTARQLAFAVRNVQRLAEVCAEES